MKNSKFQLVSPEGKRPLRRNI